LSGKICTHLDFLRLCTFPFLRENSQNRYVDGNSDIISVNGFPVETDWDKWSNLVSRLLNPPPYRVPCTFQVLSQLKMQDWKVRDQVDQRPTDMTGK